MASMFAQVLLLLSFTVCVYSESAKLQEEEGIRYESLAIKKSVFGEFSMLAQERDDYATTLTRLALDKAREDPSDEVAMKDVKRLLALALHLSPRNRAAVVANHQMGRGVMPAQQKADYSSTVFARLLLTRGKLLKKQKAESDNMVGLCFIALAAELDPRNEEAVYASEIQKIDGEEAQWSLLLGEKKGEEEVNALSGGE